MYRYWNCSKNYKLSDVKGIRNYLEKYHIMTELTCDNLSDALKYYNKCHINDKYIRKDKEKLQHLFKYISLYSDMDISNDYPKMTGFVDYAGQNIYFIFDSNVLNGKEALRRAKIIGEQGWGDQVNKNNLPIVIQNLNVIFTKIYGYTSNDINYDIKLTLHSYIKYVKDIYYNKVSYSSNLLKYKWFQVEKYLRNKLQKQMLNDINSYVQEVTKLLNIKRY